MMYAVVCLCIGVMYVHVLATVDIQQSLILTVKTLCVSQLLCEKYGTRHPCC